MSVKNMLTQQLPPEVEDTVRAIASSINAGQTLVFCGAGISRDSGFPVVNDLVPRVLLTLCARVEEIRAIEASLKTTADVEQSQERLKHIIAKRMEASPEVVDKIIGSLPFEAFIEILRDNSQIHKILEIYDADAYEPSVKSNTNHMMLARLLATGKVRTIVTTNFDQLIEKALEQQHKQVGLDYDVIHREEDFDRIDWSQDRSRLIKLHGSIEDKQAMSITLSRVAKRELSAARAGIIRHVFSQGSHERVLILGYSCSDVFDISPQIEVLAEDLKQVCLVQHSGSPRIEYIREQEQKNPFKAFHDGTRLFFNTGDLVKTLWQRTLNEPYEDHKPLGTNPDWTAKVQAWYLDSMTTPSEVMKDAIPGQIFDAICEWRAAIVRHGRVIAYAKEHANDALEAIGIGNMGRAFNCLGESSKAIRLYEQALKIAQRNRDTLGEGRCLGSMGNAYLQLGKYDEAIGFHEQALEIARRNGDSLGEGSSLGSMGDAYLQLGKYDEAIGCYEQALEVDRRIGWVKGEGADLANMGMVYSNLGEYGRAIEFYEQALRIDLSVGNAQGEGAVLDNMGSAYMQLGEHRKAIDLYEQALKIDRRIGNVQGESGCLGNIGTALAGLGEYSKAIEFYELALKITHRIRDVRGEGSCLGNMGLIFAAMGNKGEASQAFAQSKAIFAKSGMPHMVGTIDKIMEQVGF